MVTLDVPGTILSSGDLAVNKMDKVFSLKFIFYRRRQKPSEEMKQVDGDGNTQ